MLTRKQHELLMFVHERLKEAGVPPSFDEMKDALDLRSKSGIHRLIKALEERGFIRRLPNRARAIEVMRLPESMHRTGDAAALAGFSPSVIEGSLGRVRPVAEGETAIEPVMVPGHGPHRRRHRRSRRSRPTAIPSSCRRRCSRPASTSRSRCAATR